MTAFLGRLALEPHLSPVLGPIDEGVDYLVGVTGLHFTGVRVLIIYISTFFIALGFRIK